MAGALCTEMKRGQVRTRAVIKSRSAGEAQSWWGARAPRCSAPRLGLRLCPGVPRAWCPSHRALSSPCSPPCCPCANPRGQKTLAGCGAPDGRAGLCRAVPRLWGTGARRRVGRRLPLLWDGGLGLAVFVNTQLLLRARTKPDLWRPSINYNILGTVISTSGLLNFVLIGVSLFLSQHFFPSAGYRSFLCGDLTNC